MATYKLPGAPEVTVSVRGKDSVTTRQKALDKITVMLDSGELSADSSLSLSAEELILHEVTATNLEQEDETQEPLDLAIRELQKFSFLKIRTQKLRQDAVEIRDQIETILTSDEISQEQEPSEESLKSGFKTLKEYASLLKDCRLAKPKAKTALSILDEALQFNLSFATDSPNANESGIETKVFDSDAIANPARTEPEDETVNVMTSNGYQNSLVG